MYKKLFLVIILFFSIIGLIREVNAETVNASLTIPYREKEDWVQFNGLGTKEIYVSTHSGLIYINLSKVFNFLKDDGSTIMLNSTLDIGKKLNSNLSSTLGNYSINGNSSLNLDNSYVSTGKNCWIKTCHHWKRIMKVFNPVESNTVEITSTNPSVVECVNNVCTSKSPGVANIIVNFPNKKQTGITSGYVSSYELQWKEGFPYEWENYTVTTAGNIYYGSDYGYGNISIGGYGERTSGGSTDNLKNMAYSFPSITYTVTVPGTANTSHVSTCTGASPVTKDSATVNWSYTDVDNDPQTQYQVQLSTKSYIDPTFTNTDIVFASSSASANTSHTFTGLTPNTTYYARIKTQNAVNGWSTVYNTCNAGFKTLTDDSSQPTCACNSDRDYVCQDTAGTVTSTKPNDSQCDFALYCSVATTTTTTTFTFGPTGHRIGSIKYEHSGDTPEIKTGPYDYSNSYTVNKTEGERLFTVTLTDLGDNTTLPPKTCSVTNTTDGDTSGDDDTPPASCTTQPCDTKIKITKKPAITLNKGGTCTLKWVVENRPATGMTCTLTGTGGTTPEILADKPSGTWPSPPLYQNTKYTIKCTSVTLATTISASAICRINPSIGEI